MKRVFKYLISSILFAVVTFILIMIFDHLEMSPNDSGFLNNLSNIELIDLYHIPEFNGLYTLCLFISVLIFIFGLFSGWKKRWKIKIINTLIFVIYSFYDNSITIVVGALIFALVSAYYMIKEIRGTIFCWVDDITC